MNFYEENSWWHRKDCPAIIVRVRCIIGFPWIQHINRNDPFEEITERDFRGQYEPGRAPPDRRTVWGKVWADDP
jgi:hypothetical protein